MTEGPDPIYPRDDPWNSLCAIRRLDVGPVRIERNRLACPYRIHVPDGIDEAEFVYRFTTEVFDPTDSVAVNLASVMAAQVALNYGLFCDQIVFHGPFDETDRRFLSYAMENTSREIAVIKFLQPNPFLRGPAAELPLVRRRSYTRARIRYVDAGEPPDRPPRARRALRWSEHPERVAILSSGGKESLLSLGLLREIGATTHPLFVNESGRHWLTALNAYRYLSQTHPGTDRVWTNSDRMFSWFLRHLPFVRKNFADVRADAYPIRLWTVAVYLFGVLPLLRKHGISRLVIGDEYDTTRRASLRGISHYDGLYDQSRFFDRAMTRYFHRKGWGVEQFSLVRPLSELLVQKTLTQRYPDLYAQQVSCHATHTEGERIKPCGKCEKCRRIVAMLTVLGEDPGGCGYTPAQVERCLQAVAERGVHQEKAGAQHLSYLLERRGLLGRRGKGTPAPREHPEIEQLRFDADRSPPDGIPADLRTPIYSLLLQHAKGAVVRIKSQWLPYPEAGSYRADSSGDRQENRETWKPTSSPR